ncbi:MAG TPA: biopolymer transporter ExbD [Elusimicrobia bacterium]|nr:biopolymer transporter ExbD [Elusimicrobiota bacterium]
MAGAQQGADDDPITAINVTPLVDVSLVLVIIFMAIAPFAMTSGIKVLESKAKSAVGKVSASDNVSIRLTKDGKLTVNDKPTDFTALFAAVTEALSASKDKMAMLKADDENKVGDVVRVLDTAKQAGALKIAILRAAGPEAPASDPEGGSGGEAEG